MQKIARSNYKIMPWQNGLGVTAEIDRVPGGEGRYLWRLSQASIQSDAPFSTFAGYDRWLAVWRGGSIVLNDRTVSPLEPVRFSGDDKTFCRLLGAPVLDVGLIFDRSKIDASMSIVEDFIKLPTPSRVYYIFDLESGDTIKLDHAAEISVKRSLLVSVWEI
jgi:environmental stress-induced protein Ves